MTAIVGIVLLVALQLTASSAHAHEQGSLVYSYKRVVMPGECRTMNYCMKKGKNYPHEEVKALEGKLTNMIIDLENVNVTYRYGGERSPCASKHKTSPVYYIRDESRVVRVVVQIEDRFEQIYGESKCTAPGVFNNEHGKFSVGKIDAERLGLKCQNILREDYFYVLSKDFTQIEKVKIRKGIPVYCALKYDYSLYRNMYQDAVIA